MYWSRLTRNKRFARPAFAGVDAKKNPAIVIARRCLALYATQKPCPRHGAGVMHLIVESRGTVQAENAADGGARLWFVFADS